QAEDGIRDFHVTGVQTCALPIYRADDSGDFFAVLRPSLGALQHAEPRDGRETIACAFGLGPAALCSTGSRGELGSGCFGQRGPEIGRASCRARVWYATFARDVEK